MFRSSTVCALATSVFGLLAAAPALAATPIDISALTNRSIDELTNGASYPAGGSNISIGGINFTLATNPGNVAQIIQTGTGDPYQPQSPGPYVIDVGVAGVTDAYAIINSVYGIETVNTGSITFQGLNPLNTLTFDLIEGVNIRDHYINDVFNQTASVFATQEYNTSGSGLNNVRFDVLRFDLSAFGGDTLASVTLNGTAAAGGGMPFLAALSVDTPTAGAVPEPATWAMMIVGFGLVGGGMRRRSRSMVRYSLA